ncbi:hypothetical protein [Tetragenococcus halophilus]|uniref:hypothetical protein n=1 Tax=Tetragenococcus halophilus TaxID=51669 RepID=UPI00300F7F3F
MAEEKISQLTRNIMARFPSWMKMARDDESVGAQFLDIFGTSLEYFQTEMERVQNDFYIGTARVDMIDIIYKVPLAQETLVDMDDHYHIEIEENDETRRMVRHCLTLREFYAYEMKDDSPDAPRSFLDEANGYLYLRVNLDEYEDIDQPFKSVVINEAKQYELEIHHVWNAFDDFGLLVGLYRLERERNEHFKERILDVLKHPGNSTHDGMVNGIARELGISRDDVTLQKLSQPAFENDLLNNDGTPSKRLLSYARKINQTLRFTYDEMNFSSAYWHSIEEDNTGIYYLPHIWDLDLKDFNEDMFQSGVGAEKDLFVHAPKEQDSERTFKAYVGMMGFYEEIEEFFPEISFRYKIYATGKVPNEDFKEEPFKYKIKTSQIVDQPYNVSAQQNFKFNHRMDFSNQNDYQKDEKMHFGKSNEFLHDLSDSIMKLAIRMSTSSETESPSFPILKVIFEDKDGKEHSILFETSDDWLNVKYGENGTPITQVNYADIIAHEGAMELGYGAFQRFLDTTVDFQSGTYETNAVLIRNGGIELNRDLTGMDRN